MWSRLYTKRGEKQGKNGDPLTLREAGIGGWRGGERREGWGEGIDK